MSGPTGTVRRWYEFPATWRVPMFFAVRFQDSHEAVGLYYASCIENLCDLIDEACDPSGCEFMEMPEGGVSFSPRCGTFPGDDDEGFAPEIDGCTQSWWSVLTAYSDEAVEWTLIDNWIPAQVAATNRILDRAFRETATNA
jgi:hypothetical protein